MGTVWVAEHLTLHTEVAVKFISTELASDEGVIERFQHEAIAAAQIKSPNVVQMFDHGLTEDGVLYIVMELLEGQSLAQHLSLVGPMGPYELTIIITQVARALAKAHALGIVHRDIKPENIFLLEEDEETSEMDDQQVKVLDFGIAKQVDLPRDITVPGMVIGTPGYMCPDQVLDSKDTGPTTDCWALAVVAYYALTLELPFYGETLAKLVGALVRCDYTPVSKIRSDLGTSFDPFFTKAFARMQEERYQTVIELATGFRECAGLGGAGVSGRWKLPSLPSYGGDSSPGAGAPRVSSPDVSGFGVSSPGVGSPGVGSAGVPSPGVGSPGVGSAGVPSAGGSSAGGSSAGVPSAGGSSAGGGSPGVGSAGVSSPSAGGGSPGVGSAGVSSPSAGQPVASGPSDGQPAPSGPGAGQAAPSGPGEGQAVLSGPGAGQAAPSGPGEGQAVLSGPGEGRAAPSGPGAGQAAPSGPGEGRAAPSGPGAGRWICHARTRGGSVLRVQCGQPRFAIFEGRRLDPQLEQAGDHGNDRRRQHDATRGSGAGRRKPQQAGRALGRHRRRRAGDHARVYAARCRV